MQDRLFDIKEVTAIVKLEDQIEKIYKQIELDTTLVQQNMKLKELEILNEG